MSFIHNIVSLLDAMHEGQSSGDRGTMLMKLPDSVNFNVVYVGLLKISLTPPMLLLSFERLHS
jgi:hypothetical protein